MADIFISYSSEDKTLVKQIAALLEARGWSVWWDRQIPIGQKYDTVIENELQKAGCVLVIWTKRSVASEWVKNEALEAAQKNKLVPVELEEVTLPLAFKRIETAMLIGWNGEDDHPELSILYNSINNIFHPAAIAAKTSTGTGSANSDAPARDIFILPRQKRFSKYSIMTFIGCILAALLVYLYLHFSNPGTASLSAGKTITIRIFDPKKNPVTQGNVKIYLKEYIRTQSIDNMGQALFTGIPAEIAKNKMKIEVSSPGYATKNFDTLASGTKPIELVLSLTTVVNISGKIKTAAEIPIKGVEVDVDGTRYSAVSITDGTYNLRLEEYTLGDEITITTSHPGYEDKTVSLRINAPDIINEDIFLNQAKRPTGKH